MDSQPNPYEVPYAFPEELAASSKPSRSIRSRPLVLVIFVAWGGFLGSIWSAIFDYPWQKFNLSDCPEAIGMAMGGLLYFLTMGWAQNGTNAVNNIESN